MPILNADVSHNLTDWLIFLTIESEKTKRAKLKKEMLVQFKLKHHSVIGS
jgi:hypothetical protein